MMRIQFLGVALYTALFLPSCGNSVHLQNITSISEGENPCVRYGCDSPHLLIVIHLP